MSFLFTAKHCDRCGGPLKTRMMSKMNEDVLCDRCIEEEKKHPLYAIANQAEHEAVCNGIYNYPGLFAGQHYPFGKEYCSAEGCFVDNVQILMSIDNGIEKIMICPNHAKLYGLEDLNEKIFLKWYPSEITEGTPVCDICGKPARHIKDSDFEFDLCNDHLKKLLIRHLEPNEFKALYQKVGSIFLLHDDFYDPNTGEALQPADE